MNRALIEQKQAQVEAKIKNRVNIKLLDSRDEWILDYDRYSFRGSRPQVFEAAHQLVSLLALVQHGLLQFLNLGLQLGHLAIVRLVFELFLQLHYPLILLDKLLL